MADALGASGNAAAVLEELVEERPLHPLLVVEDFVSLRTLPDGYILTFPAGLKMNGHFYDVAALHVTEPLQDDDFYCIPYHSVPLRRGAFAGAACEMLNAGHPRQLIRVPYYEYPSLIDAIPLGGGRTGASSHAYHITDFRRLQREGTSGQQVMEQVQRIVEEGRSRLNLMSRH